MTLRNIHINGQTATPISSAVLVAAALSGACGGSVAKSTAAGETMLDSGSGTSSGVTEIPDNHRPSPPTCPTQRGSDVPSWVCQSDAGCSGLACQSDSDCSSGLNGRCLELGPDPLPRCSYDECLSDSDCPTGIPCGCRPSGDSSEPNLCLTRSHCTVDADCGPGGYCSPSELGGWCGVTYFCHTADDACVNDSDCAEGSGGCNYDASQGHWVCGDQCGPAPP